MDGFKDFACSYRHDGSEWCITIRAKDFADAEARLKSLSWGRVDGQLMHTIPGWFPVWLVALYCRYQNWRSG